MYCLQFSICLEVLSHSTKTKLLRLFVFRWEDPTMTASPLPACVIIVQQGETGTTLPFSETGRNQKLPPCKGTCQGVGSMTASSMEHGAKPPCFLPMNRLRLRAQAVATAVQWKHVLLFTQLVTFLWRWHVSFLTVSFNIRRVTVNYGMVSWLWQIELSLHSNCYSNCLANR